MNITKKIGRLTGIGLYFTIRAGHVGPKMGRDRLGIRALGFSKVQ